MLALLPASAAANPATQIIVKRDPGLTAAERRDIRADAGVRFVENLPLPRTEVVAAAPGDVRDALRDLNADPDVVYAERDRAVHASVDTELDPLWGLNRIEAPAAWTHSAGLGRTVAVIDTGIDAAHPDLVNRVIPGWDWVDNDADAHDPAGHGTHVAGIIAAQRDGLGVAGVAHESRLLPLRVLAPNGVGRVSDLIKAYDFAGDRGVRIVNLSLGGIGALEAEREAIERNPEVLFVVAAGNGDDPGDLPPHEGDDNDDPAVAQYPCAYDLPNVLCVGASDQNDEPADFSNFGDETVDVFAPGVAIRSTYIDTAPGDPEADFAERSGTSMAAPHVAGMVSILLDITPEMTPQHTIAAIVQWSDKPPALTGMAVSDGRANLRLVLDNNDLDGDGVVDRDDNCPILANAPQLPDDCTDPVDRDADGFDNDVDDCPDEPAGDEPGGCPGVGPNSDADSRPDLFDNCVGASNEDQADADRDGAGDVCDGTPRGPDIDGDGYPALDDSCPTSPGVAPVGCPAPPPPPPPPAAPADTDRDGIADASDGCPITPAATHNGCPLAQVASLSAKPRGRTATVKVRSTTAATIRITVERKKGRRWVRVTRKTVVGTRATVRVRRLKRGMHRVRISISSSGGRGTSVSKTFRVR